MYCPADFLNAMKLMDLELIKINLKVLLFELRLIKA